MVLDILISAAVRSIFLYFRYKRNWLQNQSYPDQRRDRLDKTPNCLAQRRNRLDKKTNCLVTNSPKYKTTTPKQNSPYLIPKKG